MLPRELRILDKNKLMRFEIPRSLRRMLSEQNRTLRSLTSINLVLLIFILKQHTKILTRKVTLILAFGKYARASIIPSYEENRVEW